MGEQVLHEIEARQKARLLRDKIAAEIFIRLNAELVQTRGDGNEQQIALPSPDSIAGLSIQVSTAFVEMLEKIHNAEDAALARTGPQARIHPLRGAPPTD